MLKRLMITGFSLVAGVVMPALASGASVSPEQMRLINSLSASEKSALASQLNPSGSPDAYSPEPAKPVVIRQKPEGTSRIETSFRNRLAEMNGVAEVSDVAEVNDQLNQFGYELFSGSATTFAPTTEIPIPPEYVLGPGDELRIQYYGSRSDTLALIIDRNGVVNLPNVGEISLSRLTFNQARALLAERIGSKMIGVTTSITMGRLRSIRVFVLGDVRNPGSYLVSSLSTISHALFISGGVSKHGSLRHVQLKRSGKKVAELDIYDFLLKGDSRNDRRLSPGDVVFIPPVGELVAVSGEVVRPGIYERKHEKTINTIISLAGGMSPTADRTRGQIDRLEAAGSRRSISFDLTEKGTAKQVKNGDIIQIHTLPDVRSEYVILSGAVKRPGHYGYRAGMHLSDLIASREELLPRAYLKKAEITHYRVVDGEVRKTSRSEFSLEELLTANRDIQLNPYDEVMIRSVTDWYESVRVEIGGEVMFPGTYPVAKGETLSSLIERAGGYSEDAYLPGAVFSRQSIRRQQQREHTAMVAQIEQEIGLLEAGMTGIRDPSVLAGKQKSIAGAKQLLEKMKLVKPTGRLVIELSDLKKLRQSEFDVRLRDGDRIYIPSMPSEVLVIGQVYSSTALLYNSKLKRDDYINLAGGPTRMADEEAIYIVRANGSVDAGKRWGKRGMEPGDTIVVPEDLEQFNLLDSTLDWSKVLMQVGIFTASMVAVGVF